MFVAVFRPHHAFTIVNMSAGKCKCIGAPASNNAIIALRNSICRFSDAAGLPQGEGIVVAVRQEVSGVVVSVLTARHVVFDQQNKLVGWFADFSSIPGACLYVSDVLEESSAKIEIVPGLDPCSVDWALVALEAVPDKPLDDAEQSKLLALPVWSLANVKGELYQCCKAGNFCFSFSFFFVRRSHAISRCVFATRLRAKDRSLRQW